MKIDIKHTIVNVIVTFVEGFLAAWALGGNQFSKHAIVGAGAAALSVVYNTVIKPVLVSKGVL